jgi:hypothetical protein
VARDKPARRQFGVRSGLNGHCRQELPGCGLASGVNLDKSWVLLLAIFFY